MIRATRITQTELAAGIAPPLSGPVPTLPGTDVAALQGPQLPTPRGHRRGLRERTSTLTINGRAAAAKSTASREARAAGNTDRPSIPWAMCARRFVGGGRVCPASDLGA